MRAKTTQQLFKDERAKWLHEAREVAQKLLMERDTVTINDVTAIHPLPSYIRNALLGHVFQHQIFSKVAVERSPKFAAKGHYIGRYRLNDAFYPTSVRAYRRRHMEEFGDE